MPLRGPDSSTGQSLRSGVARVGLGSTASAVAVYVALLIAARTLPVSENTQLLTWLAAFQLGSGLLTGLTTELTRSTARATDIDAGAGPRVLTVGVCVGVGAALALGATGAWWGPAALGIDDPVTTALLCLGIAGFSVHSALAGGLSGTSDWSGLGRLLLLEAGVKLFLVVGLAWAGATVAGFAGAFVGGAFAWVLLTATTSGRAGLLTRTDRDARALAPLLVSAVGAQGASAILTVGFPLLLAATTSREVFSVSAPLLLAISLTRAPLMIPLGAFQSMLITHFVHSKVRRGVLLGRLLIAALAIGALGAGCAWLIGPWLMSTLFTYTVSAALLAGLTMAAAVLALTSLTGALCQAAGLHPWFLGGWIAGVLAAIACLATPYGMEARTLLSLGFGPLVGVAVMSLGLLRAQPSGGATDVAPAAQG